MSIYSTIAIVWDPSYLCRLSDLYLLTSLRHVLTGLTGSAFSVRGMMYYRRALELQAFLDMATDDGTN